MVSTKVFDTNFNTGLPSNSNTGIPFQFSGFVKTEAVQRYNNRGSGSNVFSGLFLRNDSGGNIGGGGNVGDPQIKTTLSLTGLPTHNSIDLNFLLAVIDSWDGTYNAIPGSENDFFNVTVDGKTIFSEAFDNADTYNDNDIQPGDQTYTPPTGVFLGAGQFGFNAVAIDTAYNLGLDPSFNEIPHTSSNLTIQWYASGSGWEGGINESWAIDNLEVIVNNNPPKISISDVTITEGDTGTKNAIFNVSLSLPSQDKVTVKYATSNGTAVAPSDYTSTQGTLTFNPGQTTQNIVIPIKNDTVKEANETFKVNLTQPSFATLKDGLGIGTIINDDIPPSLSINDVTVFEGNSGVRKANFTVTLTGIAKNPVSVNYATVNGSAKAGSDFVSATGQLNFPVSSQPKQTKFISVNVKGDTLVEPDELFSVRLSNAVNGELQKATGAGKIRNDDDNSNSLISNKFSAIGLRGSNIEVPRESFLDLVTGNSSFLSSEANGFI